ncbi:MAG: hypothetical protein R2774_07080 [Saprospiraceae bacterium]
MSNTNSLKIFPSKLLLFGEYTVTLGSDAIAMPFHNFEGHWELTDHQPDERLMMMVDALKKGDFKAILNLADLERDLQAGWMFRSTIPVGYGLGSSGALVAAIFDKYSVNGILSLEILKSIFAEIESIFHGRSSGIDPLVSYLDTCLIISQRDLIRQVGISPKLDKTLLLDTGIPRATATYVEIFKAKLKMPEFYKAIEQLKALNTAAIQGILDLMDILPIVREISALQYRHFVEMIPSTVLPIWKEGLESGAFSLKLCGAGGGGMFYVWTEDKDGFMDRYPDLKIVDCE